ncbi:MAG: hypothetical protein VX641_01000 [Planctomycetota bacterium]|nr:hypothetical protein [Planctomycetota bacterium]
MNTRCFTARIGRVSLTMLAGVGLAASTLALTQQDSGRLSKDSGATKEQRGTDDRPEMTRGPQAASDAAAPGPVGVVEERRPSRRSDGGATAKPKPERIRMTPSVDAEQSPKPFPHIGAGVPGLKPQKRVEIPRELALEFDPVSGVGYMMDHSMTPRLFSATPAKASSGWTGSLVEDPYSSVFFLETAYGLCGWVSSSKFGSFRMLPGENRTKVVINSQNFGEVARCGGLIKDFNGNATVQLRQMMGSALAKADPGELATAALGGAPPQCWAPGSFANSPDSSSYFVRYRNRSCNSGPVVVDEAGTPDLPDESIRRLGFPCNGESTVVKPWFDFVVDILYGYSIDVLLPEFAGSVNTVRARAAFEVAQMNEILFNSRMRVKVRLVGVKLGTTLNGDGELVGYEGSGNPSLDLEILGAIGGTFTQGLDNLVLEERDSSGADLIACMVGYNFNPNIGGIAGGGVCILTWGNGTTTFAHEVGHLFGAQHASETSNPEGDLDSGCGEYALCDPTAMDYPNGRLPASNADDEEADCTWEDYEEYTDCYVEEICDPNIIVNDTEFFNNGSPSVIVYPEEYGFGWRGQVDGPDGITNITTTMAYTVEGSYEILNYSNPEVTFPSSPFAPFDGVTGNVSCRFCSADGNTAANAWIMHEQLLNLSANAAWSANGNVPIYLDEEGFNHFPSASSPTDPGQSTDGLLSGAGYPPNYGILLGIGELELLEAETCLPWERNGTFFGREEILPTPENGFQESPLIRPWVQVFQSGPGIAQLRCRTIPYDCNQNGLIDTEELDGTAIGGNPALLTDLNRDRVPDGCWPRECFDSPSVFDENATAVVTFNPTVQQDPNDPALMRGSGGVITDFTLTESVLTGPPVPGDADDLYWFFQPSEIRIDNLVHPRLSDLTIELVRRQIGTDDLAPEDNPTETVWEVFDCNVDSGTQALSGTYVFQVSGGEAVDPNPASTALRYRSACAVVQSNEYGYVLPSGRFNFGNFEAGATGIPFSGEWLLRITDEAAGSTGFFSGWSMKCKVLPYDEDCNADGIPDTCGEAFTFDSDCNLDNVADSCQIASDPLLDCDLNGVIDSCEDNTFLVDLGGGLWDADGNGVVDAITDTFFIQTVLNAPFFDPNLPCDQANPNGRSDLCDIIDSELDADTANDLDKNNNLFLDCFESDEVFCATRIFNTQDAGRTSGAGVTIADFALTTSTIVVNGEAEGCLGGTEDPCVTPGSQVLAGIEVTLNDFQHDALESLDLRLVHIEPDGTTLSVALLPFGCPVSGFLRPGTNSYVFSDLGQQTICEALQQSVQLEDGPDNPYLTVGGDLGSTFINRPVEGIWKLEFLDPLIGDAGSLGSWDLKMTFRPPDNDGNGTPDVCEE